jgi:hypothetical protein
LVAFVAIYTSFPGTKGGEERGAVPGNLTFFIGYLFAMYLLIEEQLWKNCGFSGHSTFF